MAEQKGCVAHIVRLAENQRFSKIDPPGVDFRIYLIINETNNVCNAPFFGSKKNHYQKFRQIFISIYLKKIFSNNVPTTTNSDLLCSLFKKPLVNFSATNTSIIIRIIINDMLY